MTSTAAPRTTTSLEDSAPLSTARLVLTIAVVANAVLAVLVMLAAGLIDLQSDILGNRSEAHGGFDPSVFPPYSDGIWLVANAAAVVAVVTLVALIATRVAIGRPTRPELRG